MNNITRILLTKGLTYIQFGLILALFILGPIIANTSYAHMAVQLLGMMLGLIALFVVGLNRFSIFPTPRQGISLITTGPFKVIRHPMYLAVLLVVSPICLEKPTLLKTALMAILLLTLIAKITVEERLLEKEFSDYSAYKKRSWRLVPLIY